jgi:zinc transport system ATP-binding protein
MRLLTCENLSLSYDKIKALDNVSFTVDSGDFMCVLGENGSGKTTLINCILGLLKQDSGTVKFENMEQWDIGYLPQKKNSQDDFPASVYEIALSGCLNNIDHTVFFRHKLFYNKSDKNKTLENLKNLDITDIKNKSYRELSGGQKQRVLLARALCASSKMLLLDEPSTGLDPLVTAEFYETVTHLNKKHGMTVIIVSHDIPFALNYSNKILHIRGNALFFGDTNAYKKTDICKKMSGGYSFA